MPRRPLSAEELATITARSGARCEYCQCPSDYSAQPFVCEHITPIAKGGQTDLSNICFACGGCNGHKYTKTEALDPVSKRVVPLYHPRIHQWSEHFSWSDDYLHVIGLTPMGRATVIALKLNRQAVMNIRSLLLLAGKHPPKTENE